MYKIGEEEIPAPGNPNMYRVFLAYLYAVACNQFEAYKKWDPTSATFLPLLLELNLD